jgi:hypothetical protein
MKSLSVKLGVLFVGVLIFGCVEERRANWKFYGSSDGYMGYYDAQSITRPSKNIVRVSARWDWAEKAVMDGVGKLGKKYENLSYSIILEEINCAEKKSRRLSATQYDHKGSVISSESSPSKWISTNPESMTDFLIKEVCK